MSLDLYVHCKSTRRLTAAQLTAALAASGIGAAIFEDYINYKPAKAGPIKLCTILGWKQESFDLTRLTEILSGDHKKRLARLFAKEVLAYAHVLAMDAAEYYQSFGEDYLDSLAGKIDQQFLDFMRLSNTVYEIATSTGRTDLSWRFQMAVCCTIAELTEGLIEEPQMGNYFFPKDAEKYFRSFAQ